MSKTITSGAVTFMDVTDNRRLDVYITSNLPNIQIKNVNTNDYTPNWTSTPLVLEADAYLDSQDVNGKTKFSWYKRGVDGIEVEIATNTKTMMVSANELDNGQLITYICKALYKSSEADNGIQDIKQITFSQTITGLNGTDGTPAPAVQAQYSIDGATNWTVTLNAATHKYIKYSYDGGKTWTTAIKMVGEDGTSVKIKGTATSKTAVSGTSYYTLIYNSATITGAAIGDAYLLDGNMYVCVDSRDGNDYFLDVGHIQGPQGNDGQSSYVFIRYATDANGANMVANPTSTTTHIGICTVNTNVAPTTASSYTWSKFVGDSAKSIILSGTSQIFKVSSDATSIYTPTTIKVTAQVVNTTVATWEYSVDGGISWTTTAPSGVSLDSSTNTLTITGKDLTSNALVIKASNGVYKDVYTVSKVFDGATGATASMAFLTNENISFSANASGQVALMSFTTNVVAYDGTTKVTPKIGIISGLPSGMTVSDPVTTSNEQILTFSIANNSNLGSASSNNGTITIPITSPVSTNLKLSWSKINTGATGVGINSTQVKYGISSSATVRPTTWSDSLPVAKDGEYLWTQTIIDYTDTSKEDTVTYTYAKQGGQGTQGNPGTSVTVTSIQYQEGASATTAPTGTWSDAVVSVTDGKYLWTKTVFSDGSKSYGVAKQGSSGTPASMVSITPSALYFKSTTGQNGTFTPDYIYLYPRFQAVSYSNWQYSTDGGSNWVSVSGANGLTVGTYGSVANALQISRLSTLYTKDITSISFRCNSNNAAVYDVISIAKIYDVVDLQIGGRNLLRWTQGLPIATTRGGSDGISTYSATTVGDLSATDDGIKMKFSSYAGASMSIPLAVDGCVENGEMYTISFDYRGNITSPGVLYFLQRTSPNVSINLASFGALVANETEWQHYEATFSGSSINDRINYQILLFYGLSSYTSDNWIEVKKESLKLEKGNKKTAWTPAIEDVVGTPGAAGADAVTFQVYSSTGYALSTNTPTATLQTFAYIGDIAISAGATYQWYEYSTNAWVAISGATDPYLNVGREDVAFSKNYKCIMTFNGTQYFGIVTLDDKNDTNKVFTTKPSNYAVGDLWIVGVDYAPYGVEVGTLLRAEHTNTTYDNADWITATKYDEKINNLQSDINTYNQYFSLNTDGLKISARDANGVESQFSTSLTNEKLSFNYGDESIAYINGTKMNIKEAEIESPLTVTGKYSGSTMLQAPVINIGNFSLIVESNGSLSIVVNT